MLTDLRIQDFAIIEDVSLSFDTGLNIITGDSGAGKSILIGAVGLVLGGRGSVDMIRSGAERARITAHFDLRHTPEQVESIRQLGVEIAETEFVIHRTLSRNGKGKITVNGDPATVGLLGKISDNLIDIHGQHEHHSLLNREHHVVLLDAFGGTADLLKTYQDNYGRLVAIRAELEKLDQETQDRERRIDFLRYQIDEIDGIAPTSGEEEELRREASVLGNTERILTLAEDSYAMLYENDDSISDRLGRVLGQLNELAALDERTKEMVGEGEELKYRLEELSHSLRDRASTLECNPARLAEVEERLDRLQMLRKKYGSDLEAVLGFRDEAARELERLKGSEESRAGLNREYEAVYAQSAALAEQLSRKRAQAARGLEKKVEHELADLMMGGTRFLVQLANHPPAPGRLADKRGRNLSHRGAERVEFLVSTNAGESPKPLTRIASGGELSRIMLAIKTMLAPVDRVETLIFDEIDSGVGGGIAEILGRRLRFVSKGRQVICVTHLPQVASQGHTHTHISKEAGEERSVVTAQRLSGKARIQEIARMLGGVKITQTTVKHAREMLEMSG
jgi:DNA repair protein RecN (Recombination protein N)